MPTTSRTTRFRGNITPASYDYVVRLVRERGQYPLALGEYSVEL